MKFCKCGDPVRKGMVKLVYITKSGKKRVYEYPHYQCQKCTNKTKKPLKNKNRIVF